MTKRRECGIEPLHFRILKATDKPQRMRGSAGGDKRSALFVQSNLELLGFGNHRDALVQTVKELFENGAFPVCGCVRRDACEGLNHSCATFARVCGCVGKALDATQLSSPSSSWDDTAVEMLRIHIRGNPEFGLVDIVCADTGSGIRTHQLKQLCCGMFETTKGTATCRGAKTSGKYGLLPFAAVLSTSS